jgi:hypothetical protein
MIKSKRFGLPLLALAPVALAAAALRAQDEIVAPTPNTADEIAAPAPATNDDIAGEPRTAAEDAARDAEDEAARADASFDRTPKDCVTVTDIRRTVALDDHTILFYLRGGNRIYRNYLPRECPGLVRENRISYKTSTSRLCDIDLITVLEQFGAGLRPGFTCQLGEFTPITQEEAEDLLVAKDDLGRKRRTIKSKPVELPPAEAAPQAAPESAENPARD